MSDQKEAKLVKTLPPLPHTNRGYGIHVSTTAKNGDYIFYAVGKTVIQRSLSDLSSCQVFSQHKTKVNVARVSPNGAMVASGDDEGKVIIWEITAGVWGKVKNSIDINSNILDIDWAEDNKKIIAVGAGDPNKAKVVTVDSGNSVGKIDMHSKTILSCSYRQQRPFRIATCAEDFAVNFYEGPPFKFNKSLAAEHSRYPNCVRFSPDGSQLISVGADSKIVVFDGKSGDKVKELVDQKNGHKASIYSFSWSHDGKSILTASADKTAKLWSIEDGTVVRTFSWIPKPDTGDMLVSTFWHKGAEEYVGVISLNGAITLLDLESADKPKAIIQGASALVQCLALDTPNGNFYLSCQDGQVARYDMKTHLAQWLPGKGHGKSVSNLGVSDGALVTVGLDDKIRFNDLGAFQFSGDASALGGLPVALAVGKKDSSLVAVALTQKKLLLFSKKSLAQTVDLSFEPTSVDFSSDDTLVALGGKDKKVHVFKLSGGKLSEGDVYSESDRPVTFVGYRPGSNMLATIDGERRIYFYEDGKNKNVHGWDFHSQSVTAGAWSPSGARFATGSADQKVIIWSDFKTFSDDKRLVIPDVHVGGVDHLAWWDENTLISVGVDRSVRIWDVPPLS